jgi:hypothetical protein
MLVNLKTETGVSSEASLRTYQLTRHHIIVDHYTSTAVKNHKPLLGILYPDFTQLITDYVDKSRYAPDGTNATFIYEVSFFDSGTDMVYIKCYLYLIPSKFPV